MKNLFIYILLGSLFLSSCEENDGYTGSPSPDAVTIEDLNIQISSTESQVTASQDFPVKIILPKAFDTDILIETICFLPNTNKRSRRNFVLKKGLTILEANMISPSSDLPDLPFDMPLELFVTNITSGPGVNPIGFKGFQYKVVSNKVLLNYGDSGYAPVSSNRFTIRLYNSFPSVGDPNFNNLNWFIKKEDGTPVTIFPNSQNTQPIYGTRISSTAFDVINFNNTGPENTYIVYVYAAKLISTPYNLPYRLTARFPTENVRVLAGVLNQITVTPENQAITGAMPLFKVKKTDLNGIATYTVEKI